MMVTYKRDGNGGGELLSENVNLSDEGGRTGGKNGRAG